MFCLSGSTNYFSGFLPAAPTSKGEGKNKTSITLSQYYQLGKEAKVHFLKITPEPQGEICEHMTVLNLLL